MPTAVAHPQPFGIATVAINLAAAKEFYTQMYPYRIEEGMFGPIKYFSILKDGITLVSVFQRSDQNPIQGTIPILRVESVPEYARVIEDIGGKVIIPESVCPCTNASFALCADHEGNQFIIKEATPT